MTKPQRDEKERVESTAQPPFSSAAIYSRPPKDQLGSNTSCVGQRPESEVQKRSVTGQDPDERPLCRRRWTGSAMGLPKVGPPSSQIGSSCHSLSAPSLWLCRGSRGHQSAGLGPCRNHFLGCSPVPCARPAVYTLPGTNLHRGGCSAFWSVYAHLQVGRHKSLLFTHLSSVCKAAPVDQMGELLIIDLWKIHETRAAT